ncbi:MAG TPA: ATP-binding cassette domain-containing protein [Gemmatimonadota bacterium]|jgi:phospholipid/cholesterol/gamma-HCH transport system ATP-binding protein
MDDRRAPRTTRGGEQPGAPGAVADDPHILFQNVHFWHGPTRILDGVSFQVPRGRITVVLGPSGTGKSTLLWLMLGLWTVDGGRILLDGRDTTSFTERDWKEARRNLSMVFQENALFDSLTVGENVGYAMLQSGDVAAADVERKVRETMQLVELDPDRFIDRMPDQLSGGQKRRVAIARAIAACDPEAILYDEPTTGLDPGTARRIGNLILKLRHRHGTTSVVVTHEIADALRVGDHFILLEGGKVLYEGDAAGLLASDHPGVRGFLEPFLRSIDEIAPKVGEALR